MSPSPTPSPTPSSTDRGTESDASTSTSSSLLSRLRSPTASELSRPWKVHKNPPPKGKRRSKGRGSSNSSDPDIPPSKRVSEFPNELLTVSAGKLFCKACRELSVKKSTIEDHVGCEKHIDSKQKFHQKEAREKDIAEALQVHNDSTHLKGETLPHEVNVYRVKVVQTFLHAGVPVNKINIFCPLLEEHAYQLCDTRHLLDLVPFILAEEKKMLKEEIKGKYLSVTSDGTTRLGKVLAIVIRFISDWKIQQRLVRLEFLTKSMTGEEIARKLINVLSTVLGIQSNLVLAVMTSVNNVAMHFLGVVYPFLLDIGCISHTLDTVEEKCNTPTLATFSSLWISLFSHSPKAKAVWKQQTGKSMASYSKTRWWSRWEVLQQLMVQFGDILKLLEDNKDIGPATRPKLLQIMTDPQSSFLLKIELAAVVDFGEQFVKATYRLEGDGPIAVECYEIIATLKAAIHTGYYPNVEAVTLLLRGSNPALTQQWLSYARGCVQGSIDYFEERFGDESKNPLAAFKSVTLFSPLVVHEMQPKATDLDSLKTLPFIDESVLSTLKAELPSYLTKASQLSSTSNFDLLVWWKNNKTNLPHWSGVAQKVFLLQPSSGAAERVFSLLNNSFSDQQQNTLEDYVEASIMLQYNSR